MLFQERCKQLAIDFVNSFAEMPYKTPEDSIKANWIGAALIEPRCEKTGIRGFRPGPTQNGLHSHR